MDRRFGDQGFVFARTTYERDEFDGFDNRIFFGFGGGYTIFDNDKLNWAISGGPGYRRDVIADTGAIRNEFAGRLGSNLTYRFNVRVQLENLTEIVGSEFNVNTVNDFSITSELFGNLALRFGVRISHDTNPPFDTLATDTVTRASLVYRFGAPAE